MVNNAPCDVIVEGDVYQVLKTIPENSIDLIATDPPYGLQFMNKSWDKAVPNIWIWKECYRVLKPGAFAFVMCIPRLDCLSQMAQRLEQAKFDIGFTCLYWCFASGFPKAENISKAVDKKLGAKREVIGYSHQGERSIFAPDGRKTEIPLSISNSKQAKALDGSYGGFQPKPAVEVIIVAMKPLSEKTYVDQALKNVHGITWLDACRIPIAESDRHEYGISGDEGHPTVNVYGEHERVPYKQISQGRFPANLIVSDNALDDGQERKTGDLFSYQHKGTSEIYGEGKGYLQGSFMEVNHPADSGSFSRYFDLDAWASKKLSELPESVQRTFPFLIVPKASKSERNRGLEQHEAATVSDGREKSIDNPFQRGETLRKNLHPTVKPLKLMSYLVTLGSCEGDVVLDPFVGSGTTVIAAKMLKRHYIGIEINGEYVEIAKARLSVVSE